LTKKKQYMEKQQVCSVLANNEDQNNDIMEYFHTENVYWQSNMEKHQI